MEEVKKEEGLAKKVEEEIEEEVEYEVGRR